MVLAMVLRARGARPAGTLVAGLTLVLMATACSGGAIDESELAAIVLQPDEASDGTFFVEAESGPVSLEELTADPNQSARLLLDGFVSGYDAIFASPGLAGVEGDISRSRSRLIDSSIFLYTSSEGAESSFGRLKVDAEATFQEFGPTTDLTIDELGTDAYGIRVEFSNPAAGPDVGIVHSWRVDNVILRIVVWGEDLQEAEVRALVDIVDGRARR